MAKCRKCRHYNLGTHSCGRLILGDTVKVKGEAVKLCGCIMPVKAKLKLADCPLNKWQPEITKADREFWTDLLARLDHDPRKTLTEDDRNQMVKIYETAFNTTWGPTNCSKCWMNMTKSLTTWFQQAEEKQQEVEEKKSPG